MVQQFEGFRINGVGASVLLATWRQHKFPELKAETAAHDPWSALHVVENAPRSVAADFLDPSVWRFTGLLQAAAGFVGAVICMSPWLHPKI